MPKERDEIAMNKNKRGLILTMMQQRFEENVYAILDEVNFQNMDELDAMLDEKLREYFDECDVVKEYYDKKIYS